MAGQDGSYEQGGGGGQAAGPFLVWGRWCTNLGLLWGPGGRPSGVSGPLTFGITVLEGDGPLVLGGEAPTTREAQGPPSFRLVGATWTRLAGLEPIDSVLAR